MDVYAHHANPPDVPSRELATCAKRAADFNCASWRCDAFQLATYILFISGDSVRQYLYFICVDMARCTRTNSRYAWTVILCGEGVVAPLVDVLSMGIICPSSRTNSPMIRFRDWCLKMQCAIGELSQSNVHHCSSARNVTIRATSCKQLTVTLGFLAAFHHSGAMSINQFSAAASIKRGSRSHQCHNETTAQWTDLRALESVSAALRDSPDFRHPFGRHVFRAPS